MFAIKHTSVRKRNIKRFNHNGSLARNSPMKFKDIIKVINNEKDKIIKSEEEVRELNKKFPKAIFSFQNNKVAVAIPKQQYFTLPITFKLDGIYLYPKCKEHPNLTYFDKYHNFIDDYFSIIAFTNNGAQIKNYQEYLNNYKNIKSRSLDDRINKTIINKINEGLKLNVEESYISPTLKPLLVLL